MDNNFRGVMVGAGFFADIQLEAWASVHGGGVVGIYDQDFQKAQHIGHKYGIEVYSSFDDMLTSVKPHFIDICTPPDSHSYYARLAADASLPILCQKPLSTTLKEGRELVQYCKERRVPLMINENWRWQAWYREIKKLIDAKALGEVYTAYFSMRPGDGWGSNPYAMQPYFKEMEKFLLFETGVHYIDTFRYLFGEMESVYCRTRTINPVIKGEDFAIAQFHFDNGITVIYDANRTTYKEHERSLTYGCMTIEGTGGSLRLQEDGRLFYTARGGTEQEHKYHIPANGWKGGSTIATQQHFIDGLAGKCTFETSGEDYLITFETVFACYQSASSNKAVSLLPRTVATSPIINHSQ
ncbi:Gfo/Idh/MocA family protein [Paenibacillus sp. JSM ZJ436]|uniref:Gfo/Idh/MocA family protein n=1 Tax=Paenibacillus sp. JSM ZJ436 TaxID=3376190 RepID=UPI0037AEAA7E